MADPPNSMMMLSVLMIRPGLLLFTPLKYAMCWDTYHSMISMELSYQGNYIQPYRFLALWRFTTIYLSVLLFFLVFKPLDNCPHGEHEGFPPDALPSPPPIGWSTGFIATPRTTGLLPIQREIPPFPSFRFVCWGLDTTPIVARQLLSTFLCSPETSNYHFYEPVC